MGKLSAVKGHEYFLEAAARIAQKRDDVRFLVVGDGPRREELQDLSRKLGIHDRTVFAGARNDVPALLGLMSVFVLPSVSEGAPNIVMEAMAAGVPIVATDVGGVADVVGDPGAAKLVPARDPEAIAGAVGDLLSDPAAARAMGRTAARVARERHDIDVVVRRMEDAFLRLLGKRAPGRIMPHRKGGEGIVGAVHGGIQ